MSFVTTQEGLVVGNDIHYAHLEIFFLQKQVLVLTMDVYQQLATLTHECQGHGGVVDKCATFSVGTYFPSKNAVSSIVVDVVFLKEIFKMVSAQVEMCLYDAFIPSFLDLSGICALAQEQMDGTEDDAFAGSCFTGDDRESRIEFDVEFIDECEVLDVTV